MTVVTDAGRSHKEIKKMTKPSGLKFAHLGLGLYYATPMCNMKPLVRRDMRAINISKVMFHGSIAMPRLRLYQRLTPKLLVEHYTLFSDLPTTAEHP